MKSTRSRSEQVRYGWGAGVLGMAAVTLGAMALMPIALADDGGPGPSEARLSYVDGQVQIAQGNQVLAEQAPLNAPLVAGTSVTTGQDGQAEIQFQDGGIARIAPNSSLTLTALPEPGGQGDIVLENGLGYFELQDGSTRVHFGDSVATAGGLTVFRVDRDKPPGALAVFSGNIHLEQGETLALDLHGGESVELNASDLSQYNLAESIEPDSWDAWNSDRDQALSAESAEQTPATNGYPNSDNPAWNDLNANGNWYNVPGEGEIWSPYEASNPYWDPYGEGSWVWAPDNGYVWASSETWGFLPYQCGAWNYFGGFGWGWSPGLMGGCGAGWWFGGYPGAHIIQGSPGYRRITRPNPRYPGSHYPHPPIAVNRHTYAVAESLPSRDRNTPVRIAGSTVMPVRAQTFRQSFDGGTNENMNHSAPAYSGYRFMGQQSLGEAPRTPAPAVRNSRPAYTPPAAAYRGTGIPNYTAPSRGYNYTPPSRSYNYTPPSRSPSYAPPSRGYSYTPPRASSGGFSGGGGMASHPAGGGGGGAPRR